MRRRKLCELEFVVEIEADGPILVKSERDSGLLGASMCFVRTRRGDTDSEAGDPFLPGTSLKGVLRSHAERLVRTLAGRDDAVCLPYVQKASGGEDRAVLSCGSRLSRIENKGAAYASSCLACRLFGSLAFGGRIAITDGYLVDKDKVPLRLEVRDGVAIDRRTGAAARGAKFQFEALVQGRFLARIRVDNWEAWQAGMIAAVLEDFLGGRVPVGMGASRGLGRVTGKVREVRARWYGAAPEGWVGIERLMPEDEARKWGLRRGGGTPPALGETARQGVAVEVSTDWKNWEAARAFLVREFMDVCRTDDWPARARA